MGYEFRFYDFVDSDGVNVIRAWLHDEGARGRARLNLWIAHLEGSKPGMWGRPQWEPLKGNCRGLYEIRAQVQTVQYRLLASFGPRQREVTILTGAIKKGRGGSTMSDKLAEVWESLDDPEYRREWAAEHVGVGLAFQIRALRESRKLTQDELAKLAGKVQAMISQWENPNYGRYSLSTLKELAAVFDVGLLVRFVPFSEMARAAVNITPSSLAPLAFADDPGITAVDNSEDTTFGAVSYA